MKLGRIGIWTTALDFQPMAQARQAAAELESMGFGALWIGEAARREPFANAGILLSATQRIVYATGIANIYVRDPMAMAAGQKTLAEAFPDRFLLGLGVSHAPMVQGRGHEYGKPVATMRAYLDAMDRAPFQAVPPPEPPPRVLAALGPKMLELARDRAWGAHPYFVPVAHTAEARKVLGTGPLLAPEQAVVLETDAQKARAIARAHTKTYLRMPNYVNNLRRLGWADEDLAETGSDRLVDAIVAWGEVETVAARVAQHLHAGADHVCIQVLTEDPRKLPMEQWRVLAGALPILVR
ncbi:MAG TPA: LLM class F420-dependent oxidoreductase [Candidatus Limnocylindrales bacterium]|nr:LLM class F420-dependent oxidoreductase [Candidatus Limnocylindrales bacterium]